MLQKRIKLLALTILLSLSMVPHAQASWQKKACWTTATFTMYASYKFLNKSLKLSEQNDRLGFHAVLQKNDNPQAAGIASLFALITTAILGYIGAQYK